MSMTTPEHVTFALVEGFTHIAFSCAVDPLRIANLISERELYTWSYASENGETATSSDNTTVLTHHSFAEMPYADRLFVISGIDMLKMRHKPLIAALRRIARTRQTKLGALCSGAYVLAKAGMLDGMKAAIHWEYHDSFMEEFPDVNLTRSVFASDENIVTASGGTATADLMLYLIAEKHGHDLATAVADQMVFNTVRDAKAEQKISIQSRAGMRNTHLAAAVAEMRDHLDNPISPSEIAEGLGISTRQLERLFGKYLNSSPKKYLMEMRLERARNLLLQTELSVLDVAIACGFQSAGHFSRTYRTAFGVSPTAQRDRIG